MYTGDLVRTVRNRFLKIALSLLIVWAPFAGHAAAQQTSLKDQIVGTWTLVLVDNVLPDGSRVQLYGPDPHGILIFDAAGRYALEIFRSGRPRFAGGDKSKGTPEEYQAAVAGSNSHFGTYAVDEAGHTITFHIEYASFPNWEGTQQKRSFLLKGDELTYTVPTPTTGGTATGEVRWKKIH